MLVGEADAARDKPPESSDLKFWKKKEKKVKCAKIERKFQGTTKQMVEMFYEG